MCNVVHSECHMLSYIFVVQGNTEPHSSGHTRTMQALVPTEFYYELTVMNMYSGDDMHSACALNAKQSPVLNTLPQYPSGVLEPSPCVRNLRN